MIDCLDISCWLDSTQKLNCGSLDPTLPQKEKYVGRQMGCGPWKEVSKCCHDRKSIPRFTGTMEGYIRAKEIGKRFDSWAMARVTLLCVIEEKAERRLLE